MEILGTSISCAGTRMSTIFRTSSNLPTRCGIGASRICTMGASSPNWSMVCLGTRSCGTGGSARLAGRLPPSSSSYKLKSTGWGGGVVRNLAVYFVRLALLLPGRGLPLSSWGVVQRRGQGRSDRLLLMSPPRAQSSLLATLSSSCGSLPAEVHRKKCKHT